MSKITKEIIDSVNKEVSEINDLARAINESKDLKFRSEGMYFLKKKLSNLKNLGKQYSEIDLSGLKSYNNTIDLIQTETIQLYYEVEKQFSEPYFKNMEIVEREWANLSIELGQQSRDDYFRLCQEGVALYCKWVAFLRVYSDIVKCVEPKTSPCFKRAIMLLEKEKRIDTAINYIEKQKEWIGNNEWFQKKYIQLLKKKRPTTSSS